MHRNLTALQMHTNLLPLRVQKKSRQWPCPHCGAVTHYPDCCPFRPYPLKQTVNRQWNANRGQSDSQPSGNPTFNQNPVPTNPNRYCNDYNYSSCNRQYCRLPNLWWQSPRPRLPQTGNLSIFPLDHNHGLRYDHSYLNVS